MILLIDNYDSFTYNLAHLFGELGAEVTVRRNDAIDPDEAERLAPSHLVLSPGPGRPVDAGACSSCGNDNAMAYNAKPTMIDARFVNSTGRRADTRRSTSGSRRRSW